MTEIEQAIKVLQNLMENRYGAVARPAMEALPATDAAVETALTVLREKLEQEKNEPLTLEELRGMGRQAVWWSNTTDHFVSIVIPAYHNEPVCVLIWDNQTNDPWRRKAQRLLRCGYKPYRRPPEE